MNAHVLRRKVFLGLQFHNYLHNDITQIEELEEEEEDSVWICRKKEYIDAK